MKLKKKTAKINLKKYSFKKEERFVNYLIGLWILNSYLEDCKLGYVI